jgi:hypothetical protein
MRRIFLALAFASLSICAFAAPPTKPVTDVNVVSPVPLPVDVVDSSLTVEVANSQPIPVTSEEATNTPDDLVTCEFRDFYTSGALTVTPPDLIATVTEYGDMDPNGMFGQWVCTGGENGMVIEQVGVRFEQEGPVTSQRVAVLVGPFVLSILTAESPIASLPRHLDVPGVITVGAEHACSGTGAATVKCRAIPIVIGRKRAVVP